MDREKEGNSAQEPFEATFYFEKGKLLWKIWMTAICESIVLLGIFMVSIYWAQQTKSATVAAMCCLFAGMLINIPVEISCSIRKSSQCISQIVFNNEGITINKNVLKRQIFFRTEIEKIEQKGQYLELKTSDGKKHSYWLGDEPFMPSLVCRRLQFAITYLSI